MRRGPGGKTKKVLPDRAATGSSTGWEASPLRRARLSCVWTSPAAASRDGMQTAGGWSRFARETFARHDHEPVASATLAS